MFCVNMSSWSDDMKSVKSARFLALGVMLAFAAVAARSALADEEK